MRGCQIGAGPLVFAALQAGPVNRGFLIDQGFKGVERCGVIGFGGVRRA